MPDPNLEIRGEGGGAGLPKKFFRTFGPQFGLKVRGGPGPPSPPLDPPLAQCSICRAHLHRFDKSVPFSSVGNDRWKILSMKKKTKEGSARRV